MVEALRARLRRVGSWSIGRLGDLADNAAFGLDQGEVGVLQADDD